jgi:UDP-glucose:(heptosyl)LPS alpha-1,3-glucosyltransferase
VAEGPKERPEVTVVAHDIGPEGGMERQLTELISGLLEGGHRVTVISRTCALPPHPELEWIRVPGPSRPFAIAYPWFLLLGSLLVRARGRGVVQATGAIVLNRVSICSVHLCHHAVARLPGFSRVSKPGPAYRLNARIAATISRLGERWCYRPGRCRRLVGVSEGVGHELRRHFPQMATQVVVIPNGVDTEAFRPADPPRGNGAGFLDAIFVGSEWRGKGLRVAIEALADCPGARLTVVGRGDVATYRRLAESIGVAERVEFAGPTPDVAPWYRRADVFLLPSAYETFSLVAHEAAACGLPLLATMVGGVEDLIRDGRNGWFVERDPRQVGERLCMLRRDPELRLAMGGAARRDSLSYSWSRMVARHSELYRQLAGKEGRR